MLVADYAKKFIIFVSSYLGGITALFYAMGYLAEANRWIRLGVPQMEIVSQQYLVTGARFFGFLLPDLIDGFIILAEKYIWFLLSIIFLCCLMIWMWRKLNLRQGLLLVGEIFLLVILLSFLRFTSDSFLGPDEADAIHLSVGTTDLLFRENYTPPRPEQLEENYRLLVALCFLFAFGALILLSAQISQRGMEDGSQLKPPKPSDGSKASVLHGLRYLQYVFSVRNNTWRRLHRFFLFWICFFILIDLLLLPVNFAHILIYKEFPVVKVRFRSGLYSEEQRIDELTLLRREKDNLLFYVHHAEGSGKKSQEENRQTREIWYVKERDIEEMRVLRNQPIWESETWKKLETEPATP